MPEGIYNSLYGNGMPASSFEYYILLVHYVSTRKFDLYNFARRKLANFELHNNIHLNQRVHMGWTTTERIESGVPLLVSPFIHESFNSLLGV